MARGFTQYGAKNILGKQTPTSTPMGGRGLTNRPAMPVVPATTKPGVVPTVANPTTTDETDPPPGFTSWAEYYQWIQSQSIGGSSGGGTYTGETKPQRLAREAAERGAQTSADYLEQQLSGVGAQYAPLLAQIAANKAELEGGVNTNYNTALKALADRVAAATTETTTNYDALRDRLTAAAPRAYANLPAAQAPALSQDAVSAYAQAIGAPTQAIGEAAVQAAAPYAGTADAYNRLIENLKANEAAGQASRLAGVDMGRTSTASRIGAQQLSSTNALDVQKNASLAQILQTIQGQQLGISQQQLAQEQSLRNALAGIYGSGNARPTPRNPDGSVDFSRVDWDALGRLMRGK
jgi:hypothetical protein